MGRRPRICHILGAIFYLAVADSAHAPAGVIPSFQGLGDLPGGVYGSGATAVSADGLVVVGGAVATSNNQDEAFRWTASTGMVGLGDFPGGNTASDAFGVSGDGSVVIGSGFDSNGVAAFRWTDSGGMVSIGDLPGGPIASIGNAISVDGNVIVGASSSTNGGEAYRWSADTGMVALGTLPNAFQSEATGISPDGNFMLGMSAGAGFRWSESVGFELLGSLPGGTGSAYASKPPGASPDGSIIVAKSETDVPFGEAFIWDADDGIQNLRDVLALDFGLDLTGWTLWEATGISADGRTIVGR